MEEEKKYYTGKPCRGLKKAWKAGSSGKTLCWGLGQPFQNPKYGLNTTFFPAVCSVSVNASASGAPRSDAEGRRLPQPIQPRRRTVCWQP